jgi:hypothetical protein
VEYYAQGGESRCCCEQWLSIREQAFGRIWTTVIFRTYRSLSLLVKAQGQVKNDGSGTAIEHVRIVRYPLVFRTARLGLSRGNDALLAYGAPTMAAALRDRGHLVPDLGPGARVGHTPIPRQRRARGVSRHCPSSARPPH